MTTYYVGPGGNNGNSGLTWALRKLTLNGAEDIPVAAGDTVYVAPGTYRETLTVDVSGGAGAPITFVGDYDGSHTDGVGGVVRITGSDDDKTAARNYCISATAKNYRTFQGFTLDTSNLETLNADGACTNWTVQDCYFAPQASNSNNQIRTVDGPTNWTIQRCVFRTGSGSFNLQFSHTSTMDSTSLIQNCLFIGGNCGIASYRVGGITVKNCAFLGRYAPAVYIGTALGVGSTIQVNNCIFEGNVYSLQATVAGEIIEDYNTFFGNGTNRTNVAVGAHSVNYPTLLGSRFFHELVSGKGRMLSPYDLASFSQLINLAGTSPAATDMRGTGTIGAQREWGPLEYDPTLLYRRVIGRHS